MKEIRYLRLPNGKEPFREWFLDLNIITRNRIRSYIDRIFVGGGKKNVKFLGDGVFEIKVNFGPGFRIYFAEERNTLFLLLLGGNKNTQERDIEKAKKYWREYVSK